MKLMLFIIVVTLSMVARQDAVPVEDATNSQEAGIAIQEIQSQENMTDEQAVEKLSSPSDISSVATSASNESNSNATSSADMSSSTASIGSSNSKESIAEKSTQTVSGENGPTNASSETTSSKTTTMSEAEEHNDFILVTKQPILPFTKTMLQKGIEWMGGAYTLSILIPIAAGVLFACTILCTIATCRCLKRRCHRRRFRKKVLPDSVKNMRPSDRARLLAETSDEEF